MSLCCRFHLAQEQQLSNKSLRKTDMSTQESHSDGGYLFQDEDAEHTHAYLWGPIVDQLKKNQSEKVFDLGCGNGAFARQLKQLGIEVVGCDPSESGIDFAKKADADIRLEKGTCYEDLASRFGQFDAVVSLEVVEHVYSPAEYARCVNRLLKPNGIAILSTPYHSYLKNLVLALTGKMDAHFTALWEHGHIKFWSPQTLTILLDKHGMDVEKILRVGRVPVLAKSMIAVARKSKEIH